VQSQGNPHPWPRGESALAFLVVVDGNPIASFSAPMAAAVLAQRLKRDDLSRAVVIMVEEAIPGSDRV
jgi:hypothetical protein